MGSTRITITVDGGSAADVKAAIDDEYELRVLKQPGACERCVMNEDPARVPMHSHCVVGSTRIAAPIVSTEIATWDAIEGTSAAVTPVGDGRPAPAPAVTQSERDFGRRYIRAVTVREYVGDVISIRTAAGKVLTGTPNHPVATRNGWVALAELHVADYVLSSTGAEWEVHAVDPDVNDVPPLIEQVAQTFPVVFDAVPTAAEDFHGDGAGSDIHVVLSDSLLVGDVESLCPEHLREVNLGGRDVPEHSLFAGSGGLGEFAISSSHSPDSVVGSGGESRPFLGRGLRHPRVHGGASPSGLDTFRSEQSGNDIPADSKGFCERLHALASGISADEVVEVRRHPFSGHVYNLETVQGWYIGNGIVTHNCRCTVVITKK